VPIEAVVTAITKSSAPTEGTSAVTPAEVKVVEVENVGIPIGFKQLKQL
jgi:hypothetical protein